MTVIQVVKGEALRLAKDSKTRIRMHTNMMDRYYGLESNTKNDRLQDFGLDRLFFAVFCEKRINGSDAPFECLPLLHGK